MPREVQIKTRPVPQRNNERGLTAAGVMSRLFVGLAVLVSVLAALSAFYGFGDIFLDPVLTITPILLGSGGALFGLIAAGMGLAANRGRPFLETAASSIFLGISALLFAVGSTLAARDIRTYRAESAKAAEVETARCEAKRERLAAEAARDVALEGPKKFLKEANDVKNQNAEKEEQIKKEHDSLRLKMTALAQAQDRIEKEQQLLANKRISLREQELVLVKQTQDLEKRVKQLELDLEKPKLLRDEALKARDEAEQMRRDANAAREGAEKKEKAAKAYYKEVVETLKEVLKPKTKAALNRIESIGLLKRPADLDLCDITYDLCEIAAKNKLLRNDALNAIHVVDADLGESATFMIIPPNDGTSTTKKWIETLKELPKYGPSGLPLIESLLAWTKNKVKDPYDYWHIYLAAVEVMGKLANEDDRAMVMLIQAPTSNYAKAYETHAAGHNRLFVRNKENPIPGAPSELIEARQVVGRQLFELSKVNSRVRKKAEVMDYFLDLLKETRPLPVPDGLAPIFATQLASENKLIADQLTEANRLLAAAAFAMFQGDARRALPQLKELRSAKSSSQELRDAVNFAIQQIQEAK